MHNEWKVNFLQNTKLVKKKKSDTKTTSTKEKMKKEWNFNFLQNMTCVQNVSRLELLLQRKNEQGINL